MISVIIPCSLKHFKNLEKVLYYYQQNTIIPDEIIISYGEKNKIPQNEIDFLKNKYFPFKLFFVVNQLATSAGQNRQIASDIASGDILIYQDADDLPHKQRIEVIKYFFDNFDIVHLCHSYLFSNKYIEFNIDLKNINHWGSDAFYKYYFPNGKLTDCLRISAFGAFPGLNVKVAAGATSIKKEVLEIIKWENNPI